MDIQKLIEKRANLWEETKNFLETHTDKDGKISAEDVATYEKMENDVNELSKNIERFQRQAATDSILAQPISKPILNNPAEKISFTASDEYRKAALNAFRTNFRNVQNVLQEKIDEQGGYLVPDEWDRRLIDVLTEENVMRTLGTKITTSGDHKINIAATKPAASWIEEGESLTFGDATFDQIILDAHKLHVAIKVTEELLYDNAFNLESYIIEQFGKALANAEEDAFLNGIGEHKPTGLFKTATEGETTTGASISADDILSLVYSLKRPYRRNAAFLINDRTLAAIRKLKDANQAYMWQPSYQSGEPDRLLGYAVHTSPYVPTISAGNPVLAFGDFSYYNIGDRGTRAFQELKELFAGNGMVGFVMKERVDGKLVLKEAVKVLKIKGGSSDGNS